MTFNFSTESTNSNLLSFKISSLKNDARYRHKKQLSWSPLNLSKTLQHRDQVFTGEDSWITIKDDKGNQFELGPQSMIEVSFAESSSIITLKRGSLRSVVNKDIKIKVTKEGKDIEIMAQPSGISLSLDAKENLKIQSSEPTELIVEGQEKIQIKANEELEIAKGSDKVIIPSVPQEIAPSESIPQNNNPAQELAKITLSLNDLHFLIEDEIDIPIKWNDVVQVAIYHLTLKNLETLNETLIKTKSAEYLLKMKKPGRFSFSIKAFNSENQLLGKGEFPVLVIKKIFKPASPKLNKPKIQSSLLKRFFDLILPSAMAQEVAPSSQEVVPSSQEVAPPSQEVAPPSQEVENIYIEKDKKVLFSWNPVEGAVRYLFELSQSNSFETILVAKESPSTEINIKMNQVGIYYWRVSAIGENGLSSAPSEPAAIHLNISEKPIDIISSGGKPIQLPVQYTAFIFGNTLKAIKQQSGNADSKFLESEGSGLSPSIQFRHWRETDNYFHLPSFYYDYSKSTISSSTTDTNANMSELQLGYLAYKKKLEYKGWIPGAGIILRKSSFIVDTSSNIQSYSRLYPTFSIIRNLQLFDWLGTNYGYLNFQFGFSSVGNLTENTLLKLDYTTFIHWKDYWSWMIGANYYIYNASFIAGKSDGDTQVVSGLEFMLGIAHHF